MKYEFLTGEKPIYLFFERRPLGGWCQLMPLADQLSTADGDRIRQSFEMEEQLEKEKCGIFDNCLAAFEILKGWDLEKICTIYVLFDKHQSFILYGSVAEGGFCFRIDNPSLWLGFLKGALISSGTSFDALDRFNNFLERRKIPFKTLSEKEEWIWSLCKEMLEESLIYLNLMGHPPEHERKESEFFSFGGGKTFELIT